MRECDHENSRPWLWRHKLDQAAEIVPGEPYRYDINLIPTANVYKKGHRIALGVSSGESDGATSFFQSLAKGHVLQQNPSWVTIHHDADHPSVLHVPIVRGNRIGTYVSEAGDLNEQPRF